MVARALAEHGIAVLRFDFTGLGESGGAFGDTTFSGSVDDVRAAADLMTQRGLAPRLLIGHSLGGAAVLLASPSLSSVKAVATIGTPAEPQHATHLFHRDREAIVRDGSAHVTIADRSFRIGEAMIHDLERVTLLESMPALQRALLIMHAPEDTVVPISHAARLYGAARHSKSFISLTGADHLLTREGDARYAAAVLAAWAERYIAE